MLYDLIKQAADDQHIKIYKLEQAAGLSNGSISSWKHSTPSFLSVCKVAEVLDLDLEMLAAAVLPETE